MDNGITYVDKPGLQGLTTFHEAGIEITDGYSFNQGTQTW